MEQVTIRAPPKAVFDSLCDVSVLEEFTPWHVHELGDKFEEGFEWEERRFLRRRRWTVVAFDRRGLSFTAEWNGVRLTLAAKKGGTMSCNVQMHVDGDARAAARFLKSDAGRLEGIRRLWEG